MSLVDQKLFHKGRQIFQMLCIECHGEDAKGNEYSYITVTCTHRKKVFELKYLAIMLNGKWFVGDELLLERIE